MELRVCGYCKSKLKKMKGWGGRLTWFCKNCRRKIPPQKVIILRTQEEIKKIQGI